MQESGSQSKTSMSVASMTPSQLQTHLEAARELETSQSKLVADEGDAMVASGHPRSGAKRTRLTLGQKRELLDLAQSQKFTQSELARKFQVGRTTVTSILKNETTIRRETDSADDAKKMRKTASYEYDLNIVDEALHKWRMETRISMPDVQITGSTLQRKALEFTKMILSDERANLSDKARSTLERFSASNGWLDGFRNRFGPLNAKQQVKDVPEVDLQTRIREFHEAFDQMELQDIWAGHEFMVGCCKEETSINDTDKTPLDNGQFTASMFVSAAGEVFDLHLIVKSNELFRATTPSQPHVLFDYSKNGLQTAHTMLTVLRELNALAKRRHRRFTVILDATAPHIKAVMMLDQLGDPRTFFRSDHLAIIILPPNFSLSQTHPVCLGIMQNFKARFRMEMLETLFSAHNQSLAPGVSYEHLTEQLLHHGNMIYWLQVALQSIEKSLIQTAWIRSGLIPTTKVAQMNTASVLQPSMTDLLRDADMIEVDPTPNHEELQHLLDRISQEAPRLLQCVGVPESNLADELVNMNDSTLATDASVDEPLIINSVLKKHGLLKDEENPMNLESSEPEVGHKLEQCPSPSEALDAIKTLKQYLRLSYPSLVDNIETSVALNKARQSIYQSSFV